ncbi:MAG: hypothetical protein KJ971_00035 [Firmicutes bacterium]|nr:hypothetical protein [Bacillota bacterium]
MSKKVLLTMDIDWTSEAVIKLALDWVKSLNIPCILFQTHYSETIYNEHSKLFTKELHPNFCDDSDHGNSIESIIHHINQLEHRGLSIRAHKYNMPCEALKIYESLGFRFSMNNYTDMKYQHSYQRVGELYELHTFFEDGFYLKNRYPFDLNHTLDRMTTDGIYVFNVHPIHLAFNPKEYKQTRQFKDEMTKEEYRNINDTFIREHSFCGYGIKSFVTELIDQIKKNDIQFISIEEVTL